MIKGLPVEKKLVKHWLKAPSIFWIFDEDDNHFEELDLDSNVIIYPLEDDDWEALYTFEKDKYKEYLHSLPNVVVYEIDSIKYVTLGKITPKEWMFTVNRGKERTIEALDPSTPMVVYKLAPLRVNLKTLPK